MRWRLRLATVLGLGGLTVAGAAAPPARPAAKPAPPPYSSVQPLFEKYCFKCHGPRNRLAGLALHTFADRAAVLGDRHTWEGVHQRLNQRLMPPPAAPQPTAAERDKMLAWLHQTLYQIDCTNAVDPGRVTLRRLNRVEYGNTVRDLFGIALDVESDLPADEVGHGFDNNGDVLSLSTLLLEKYLEAAERVVETALVLDGPAGPRQRFEAEADGEGEGHVRSFASTGEAVATVELPAAGRYVLRARAWGQQAGPEPCRMAWRVDGREVGVVEVPATAAKPEVYALEVSLPAGRLRLAAAFINDYYQPDHPDPAQRDRNFVLDWFELQGPLRGADQPLPASHRRLLPGGPVDASAAAWRQAAERVLRPFGQRCWRRPLREAELTRLTGWVLAARERGEAFERGIGTALQAMLVSPHFLFRVESDDPSAALTDWQVATRLSYFLWATLPDEPLFALAAAGRLQDPRVLGAQVTRMLADRRAAALTTQFAGQWLNLRNLDLAQPDPRRYPTFDEALRRDMRRETELFFEHIVQANRPLTELLTADYSFLNERLATHYGVPGVRGPEFRMVKLGGPLAQQRGGLLTQASVLTVTSNPTRTSPVKRGKYVLENILGAPPPAPPPGVPPLPDDQQAVVSGTLRERMEQHRKDPNCAVCHLEMDAIGFGFENYDGVGRWRTMDGQERIQPAGVLPGGRKFTSPAALRGLLAQNQDAFCRAVAEKLLTYALGRGLEWSDRCAVDQIVKKTKAGGYRCAVLLTAVATSDPFLRRRPATAGQVAGNARPSGRAGEH
ncbi:MAG: DUF1592 domain-containing protein [Fimbriimonadaceae bacterium]|nr:DUF1592 domain-containing protein [Fimbriimonadaceae bacterium]